MRISDWSSDVCSSDLASTRIVSAAPAPTGNGHEGSESMAGTIGQGGTPEKRPVVPYLGAVKVAAAVMAVMIVVGLAILGVTVATREIGRASCRERVCQYV